MIQQSCQHPILSELSQLQTKLDGCDQEMVEKHFNAISNLKIIEQKLEKHQFLLKELYDQLFKATNDFLQEQKSINFDFKKVLDAEFKYKTAYRDVQDKKGRIMELED